MKKISRLKKGSLLGPYKIMRLIGKGGMGEVYEAFEEALNRKVALKVIASNYSDNEEIKKRFYSEGRSLARLNHQNVVTVYSLGEEDFITYIAMEFVEGKALNECLRDKPFSVTDALPLFSQMLEGTKALHRNGLIHRDLKPRNIIYQSNHTIKIVDFGVAKSLNDSEGLTQVGIIIGSVAYMSPEVARGDEASVQSDIWSLGVIFFEMLTGQSPFKASNELETLDKVKNLELKFPASRKNWIPDDLKALILRMCAKSRSDRYQSIQEVLNDLKIIVGSQLGSTGDHSHGSSWPDYTPHSQTVPIQTPKYSAFSLFLMYSSVGFFALVLAMFVKHKWLVERNDETLATQINKPSVPDIEEPIEREQPLPTNENIAREEAVEPQIEAPIKQAHSNLPPPKAFTQKIGPKPKNRQNPPKKATVTRLSTPRLHPLPKKWLLKFENTPSSRRDQASLTDRPQNPPQFSWDRIPQAESYHLQIAEDSRFRRIVVEKWGINKTHFTWLSTQPGRHYWRVRAVGAHRQLSSYSRPRYVRIILPAPKIRGPLRWEDESSKGKTLVTSWTDVPLSSQYQVLLARDRSFRRIVKKFKSRQAGLQIPLSQPGRYYLRVAALDRKGQMVSGYSRSSSVIWREPASLAPPEIQIPANGTKLASADMASFPLVLRWNQVPEAEGYRLEFSQSKKFEKVLHSTSTPKNQLILTEKFPPGPIYWRLKVKNSKATSNWTSTRYFEVPGS